MRFVLLLLVALSLTLTWQASAAATGTEEYSSIVNNKPYRPWQNNPKPARG